MNRYALLKRSTSKQIDRLQIQHQHSIERIADLEKKLQQTLTPLDEEKQQLEQRILDKDQLEATLKKQRQLQEAIEAEITRVVRRAYPRTKGVGKTKRGPGYASF